MTASKVHVINLTPGSELSATLRPGVLKKARTADEFMGSPFCFYDE
jgi:hypothetical protein